MCVQWLWNSLFPNYHWFLGMTPERTPVKSLGMNPGKNPLNRQRLHYQTSLVKQSWIHLSLQNR